MTHVYDRTGAVLVKYYELTNDEAFQTQKARTFRANEADLACVRLLHQAGQRYRIKVNGLAGASEIAAIVGRLPPEDHRIRTVRANAVTGNITVQVSGSLSEKMLFKVIDRHLATAARMLQQTSNPSELFFSQDEDRNGQSPPPKSERNATPWHNMPITEALKRFATNPHLGLTETVVIQRRKAFGANVFDLSLTIDRMQLLRDQMISVPNAILAGSAVLSLISGSLLDAFFVGAVIVFNASVGYKTSLAAEISIRSLGAHARDPVKVLRDGSWSDREPSELVPGDIVRLQAGTVPADCLLINASGLATDESSLTGESTNVGKFSGPVAVRTPMAERSNMLYAGTVITGGSGNVLITAAGLHTELGRVKQLTAREKIRPPLLQKQLDQLGRASVRNTLVACGVYLLAGLARGIPFSEILKSSASLAVAAVPEGLTAVGTVSFARGVDRMRRRGIYSRDLRSIEAIGATHYLCLDKTGTLTSHEMIAEKIYLEFTMHDLDAAAPGFDPGPVVQKAAVIAALCNDVRKTGDGGSSMRYEGSSTEVALFRFAEKILGDVGEVRNGFQRTDTIYRSTQRRFMVARFQNGGSAEFEAMKGDPSEVIAACTHIATAGGCALMSEKDRVKIQAANTELSSDGYRVLALAYRNGDVGQAEDLVFTGLIALKNPVRRGVKELIAGLRRAGIQPILITGDQLETAVSIAKELGFNGTYSLRATDATNLRGMSEREREREVRSTQVFARVSPEEKLEIVRLLQKDGSIVTMTGDGINDSPALRAADVGVAMGKSGTGAARDTADLVISDDDLSHLLHAIGEGRTIRRNLEYVTRFLLATNYCETAITIGSSLISGRCSLTPLQLLWINTITDIFPALAIVAGKSDATLLGNQRIAPNSAFFSADQFKNILRDAAIMAITPAAFLARGRKDERVSAGLTALVASQMAYANGIVSFTRSKKTGQGVDWLRITALASVAVQTILPQTPVGRILGIGPIGTGRTAIATLLGAIPAFICHGDFFRQQNTTHNDQ